MSNSPGIPSLAARRACDWVRDEMIVGLGTGRAAMAFVDELGTLVQARRWKIRAIASSNTTADRARENGLTLIELKDIDTIDLTVDGADEVDTTGNVIKGLGGALLREKVLALNSRLWLLCVGAEKRVAQLGSVSKLPVEVVPFAVPHCLRVIEAMALHPALRYAGHDLYVTDNGNHIIDCRLSPPIDPQSLQARLRDICGVVETGLFVGMRPIVLTQTDQDVRVDDYSR